MQKDSDDTSSVLLWATEMEREEHNPFLCFKSQGEKSNYSGIGTNDFLLGLQTEFLQEMFTKYAKKLFCVDATHGTNSYSFQLTTVPVLDDHD